MPAHVLEVLKKDIVLRSSDAPPVSTQATRTPVLWAASSFWDCNQEVPCPWTVQAYHNPNHATFGSGDVVKLAKNGDQFLITAVVSLGVYDASITQVDSTHLPSLWGQLQASATYVRSTVQGSQRLIASASTAIENITHSNPPERILSFTTYFEAWQDDDELKLYASAGFSHDSRHPVKVWAKLIRLYIVKL
jgi:hypothetical protein